jgi:cytochrome c oxidase subunit 2
MPRTAPRRWVPLALATVLTLLVAAGPVAAHAGGTFPDAGSEVQEKLQGLYDLVGWMAIATSVIVGLLLAYVVVKFYDPEARGESDWFLHNTRLEITWTVGTFLVLLFLGVVTAQTMYDIGDFDTQELRDDDEVTEVVALGQMWQWTFLYPDGNTTEGTLHIQANERILLYSVSCDVVHSFYVPNLGLKLDTTVLETGQCEVLKEEHAVPEEPHINKVGIEARPGAYTMSCAEFCGRGHAEMRGEVLAFEPGASDRDKTYGPPPDKGKELHVEVTGSSDDPTVNPSTIEFNTGDLTTWYVHNNASGPRTLALEAPYSASTGSIPAGQSAQLRFTASEAGSFNVTVDGTAAATLAVSSGEVRHVELSDNPWYVRDGNQFEPGESYAMKAWNNGSIGHNLYIGTYAPDSDAREVLFKTETYGAGEFRWLNVTMPDRNATLDWWCDVPGHAEAGMLDDITVGAGGMQETGSQGRSLIPGLGALAALGAIGAAAWVTRRRW